MYFEKNCSSFLDFAHNYKRTSGIFSPGGVRLADVFSFFLNMGGGGGGGGGGL